MIPLALAACLAAHNPLDPVREPARHLSQGRTAFAQGKDLAETLKPWIVKVPDAELREQVKSSGATGAVCVGIEFEIYYLKDSFSAEPLVKHWADAKAADLPFADRKDVTKAFGWGKDREFTVARMIADSEIVLEGGKTTYRLNRFKPVRK